MPVNRTTLYNTNCFADELIKMSHDHFAKQGARMTKAVKVAHMGRIMAQKDFEKVAISIPNIKGALSQVGKRVQNVKPIRPMAGSPLARPSVPGQLSGPKFKAQFSANSPSTRTSFSGAAKQPVTPVAKPTTPPTQSNFFGAQPTQAAATNKIPTPVGSTPKPATNFLNRAYSKGENIVGKVQSKLPAPDTTAGKLLGFGKEVGLGTLGAPVATTAGAIATPIVAAGGQKLLQGGKRLLSNMSANRQLKKQLGQASNVALSSTKQIGELGLTNFSGSATRAAAKAGMSPRQLHSIDTLISQGQNMPRSARKRLERAAGMSLEEIAQAGGVTEAIKRHGAGSAGRVKVERAASETPKGTGEYLSDLVGGVKDKVVDTVKKSPDASQSAQAGTAAGQIAAQSPTMAGRVGNFFNQPVGGAKTQLALGAAGIGLPILGGLGAYGAYQGMNQLAARNQQMQHQYGAQGAPINYAPTTMFPT